MRLIAALLLLFIALPAQAGLPSTRSSSGGFGDPLARDPELVLSDVLDDFTTVELAERDYGVVIDGAPEGLSPQVLTDIYGEVIRDILA